LIARKQPEAIYHLAAQANPQASVADPRGTWALNLGGTLNLLEAVRATGLRPRLVLVSSGICYGNPAPEHLPVSESCPLRPNNPYAASKGAADLLGIQHHLAHGADVVIVRPFNHAGPRQGSNYVLGGLARQVAEVEAGLRARIEVGNLDVVRDFTDVRDVVRAYRLLAARGAGGEVYNLGNGRGPGSPTPWPPSPPWPASRSRSASTPPGSAPSTPPASSPTRPSSALPPAGSRGSRSSRRLQTCWNTGGARSAGVPPPAN